MTDTIQIEIKAPADALSVTHALRKRRSFSCRVVAKQSILVHYNRLMIKPARLAKVISTAVANCKQKKATR